MANFDFEPSPSLDTVSFDPNAAFSGDGTFVLSGSATSSASIDSVEISARVDGTETDLGAATVNTDGTWTFQDHVGPNVQGFITATVMDNGGGTAATTADYSLQAGIRGERYQATQTNYNANGDLNSIALDRRDGGRTVLTKSIVQELTSQFNDTFINGGAGLVNFVFDPGYGNDTLVGFRLFGPSHDGVLLSTSDFADFAQVLRDTQNTPNGAVVHDKVSGDTLLFAGVTKKELSHAGGDFGFINT